MNLERGSVMGQSSRTSVSGRLSVGPSRRGLAAPIGSPYPSPAVRGAIAILGVGVLLIACPPTQDPRARMVSEVLAHPIETYRLYRLMRSFEAAVERKDAEAMAALVHPDAEHRGLTTGRLVQGRPGLRELFLEELTGDSGTDELDTQLVGLRFVTPWVVIGDMTIVYENYRLRDKVWPEFREHTFVVLTKRDGAWRIAATSAGGHDAPD